jgi:hypothetical protein
MMYDHNPFHHSDHSKATIIFSKYDHARVKVVLDNPDAEWSVDWDDGTVDNVAAGTSSIIHQYGNTLNVSYIVKIVKQSRSQIERIRY